MRRQWETTLKSMILLALSLCGCTAGDAKPSESTPVATVQKEPSEEEQLVATWKQLVSRVQKNAQRLMAKNTGNGVAMNIDVKHDLRKTDSLTSPYKGDLVIMEVRRYPALNSTSRSTFTYQFARENNAWNPVSCVWKKEETNPASKEEKNLTAGAIANFLRDYLQ